MFKVDKERWYTTYTLSLGGWLYTEFTVQTAIHGLEKNLKNKIFNKVFQFDFDFTPYRIHNLTFSFNTSPAVLYSIVTIFALLTFLT
jgi:hypothetical protein